MKQDNWLKVFKTFYTDQSHGSGAWLVSPKTVEHFISSLLKKQKIERRKSETI